MDSSPTGLFLLQTWTSRCLMKFYAVVAASPTSLESHKIAERIEQRILNSNPVMEAFGELGVLCIVPRFHFFWDLPSPRERGSALRGECITHCLGPSTSFQVPLASFH